jgi:hypothetical protein
MTTDSFDMAIIVSSHLLSIHLVALSHVWNHVGVVVVYDNPCNRPWNSTSDVTTRLGLCASYLWLKIC